MTPQEFARHSWQDSAPAPTLPSLDTLRARSDAFRRKIVRRNWIEYAAGIFVIVMFTAMALLIPVTALRVGAAMVVAGTLVLLWQLHRRASPLTSAEHGGALSLLEYERRELIRQRDALDSVFTWYLLPLLPGMLVVMATPWLSMPVAEWQLPPVGVAMRIGAALAVFGAVYLVNKLAARRLQERIAEIDMLRA
ncbi:hypothetical protein [Aurantiacibacter aquimixticola]|uniref:DUF2975 domain-containing protein n=1 Tax=Aurantiacibacter aquimixticola TaxID=1958945 RepID=A0A419RSX2_9SPHN|nr:hypothetical protein [Aurantiacibacter aquimixticola]RJY08876.1 hypothetical protein D6201_05425 [Aurantiacibacter aquimixticola]